MAKLIGVGCRAGDGDGDGDDDGDGDGIRDRDDNGDADDSGKHAIGSSATTKPHLGGHGDDIGRHC